MAMKKEDTSSEEKLLAEIERLKKELKKRKKYGLVWEEKPEEVVELCKKKLPVLKEVKSREIMTDPNKPVNLLIEGDNYHALSVLNYTHEKKIDVIYIDPPYNTGAKDWKYNNDFVDINDAYRHSKWLSMMSNRLHIAKNLLKEDGVLICAIDENEFYHLGLLLEVIFNGREIHCITIVHNPRGVQGNNFSYTHEYAFFVFRKNLKVIGHRRIRDDKKYWSNLRNWGGESLRSDARNCFYPVIINAETAEITGFGDVCSDDFHPKSANVLKGNEIWVYPIDKKGIERKWRYARQSVESVQHLLRVRKNNNGFEIEIGKDFGTVRTVWSDSRYDANEYGTKLVHKLVPSAHFDFPKSVYNTFDCIAPILYKRKNAIVLDYFAGSGTTGHALIMLNIANKRIPVFRQSIFVLDGDRHRSLVRNRCPRVILLPGGNRPENIFHEFLKSLPPNDKFWGTTGGYTKQFCFRNQPNISTDRSVMKSWFNSQKPYWGRGCSKLFNRWKEANPVLADTFKAGFEDIIKQMTN